MTPIDPTEVLALERQVWAALVAGNRAADARLLSDDFLGVYDSGFAGKAEHVAQLAAGPSIGRFELRQPTARRLAPDTVLLAYEARYTRADGAGGEGRMYVTSIWRRAGDGSWQNIFSQDTAAET
ncbi:MAG: nuclear transport factor 2 family protein [Pseudomonadota bacterium]